MSAPRDEGVPAIGPLEAHRRLTSAEDPAPLLVDVREEDEFAAARVAGSVLLPISRFLDGVAQLPQNRPLIVICQSGGRSASATAWLTQNGHRDTVNLSGGILAWYRAGLPIRTGPPDGDEQLPG